MMVFRAAAAAWLLWWGGHLLSKLNTVPVCETVAYDWPDVLSVIGVIAVSIALGALAALEWENER